MLKRIKTVYNTFPSRFWVLISGTFVDRLGGTMLFPFFTLYITERFEVGMTQAGILLAVFSLSGMAGAMIGGALSDKFGRKSVVLIGLVSSGVSSLAMGLVTELSTFYILAGVAGFLGDIGGPARMAMVADLLPEEKRASGYGMMRVAGNLAWVAGPSIGGLLVLKSYFLIFVMDAATSLITAVIIWLKLPETHPDIAGGESSPSFFSTLKGYGTVFGDRLYIAFIGVSILMLLVYQQLYSTFSVYLRDVHGFPARNYGILMSINALVVVVFQFRVTRSLKSKNPMLLMALGTLCFLAGYTLFGIVHGYVFFIAVMLLVTYGEMIIIPVGQTLVAQLAPEKMRGRYMGIYNLSWMLPSMIGPYFGGLVIDNYNPDLLWYICGAVSLVAAAGFMLLYFRSKARLQTDL